MRGYFGVGVEGISKPMNAGNLFRSAHAFGARFIFTINAQLTSDPKKADPSNTLEQLPFFCFKSVREMRLPEGCSLVGVEMTEGAVNLPSFRHPRNAAYILGMERGSISPELLEYCDYIVKIPTRFSLNLATAGAIVMYDRLISVKQYGARPVVPSGPIQPLPKHEFGKPIWRKKRQRREKLKPVYNQKS